MGWVGLLIHAIVQRPWLACSVGCLAVAAAMAAHAPGAPPAVPSAPALAPTSVLSYATYLGGSAFDVATDVAVDADGNVYVTGSTNSFDFPSSGLGLSLRGGGTCGSGEDTYPCFDIFVAKFDPTGRSLVYVAYFGGSGDDYATGIAVDTSGNAYITGYTNSADFPTSHAVQARPGGGTCGAAPNSFPCFDAIVAKLDATGAMVDYATYLGGRGDDYGQGIAVDSVGNAVVSGFTASADFPTLGALQSVFGGAAYDAFVTKLATTGSEFIYSTFLGGSGEDYALKIAMDSSGDAYVTGYSNSTDFPVANAMQPVYGGGTCGAPSSTIPCFDAFVTKLSKDGARLAYSTYLGGSGGDYGYGIAVDSTGHACVTGLTTSTDFPVTSGALQVAGGGTTVDAFVTKLDTAGSSAVYSTYLGGIGADAGLDVAVDSGGSAYIAGYTYGAGVPLASPVQATSGGFYDAFLAKLNAAGSALVFSTYLGGSGNERANGVAADSTGNAYLAGETFSTDFPTTSGVLQPLYGGGAFDGFVTKLTGPGVVSGPGTLSASDLTFGEQLVGTTSAPQTVTLSNSGDLPLALSGIVASGDFESTNQCGSSLAPALSCTMQVVFLPTARGVREGALTINQESVASPLVVSLTGTGLAPEMILSQAAVAFGQQVVNMASPQQTVTVTNSGDAHLALTSIATSGDFAQTNTCEGGVSAGQSCAISVAFNPTTAGLKTGTLTVTNSLPHDVANVALSGTGSDFSISASPATRTIAAGQAATFTISLSPAGGFHEAVTLVCSGAPRAATCSLSPAPAALDGTNSTTSTLTVTTTAGSRAAPPSGVAFPRGGHRPDLPLLSWFLAVLALGTMAAPHDGGSARRQSGRIRWSLQRVRGALLFAALGSGCGGGGAPPPPVREGTPPGAYTLTATANSGALIRSATVTVTVR